MYLILCYFHLQYIVSYFNEDSVAMKSLIHFQVAKRATGIAPDHLVEPLRELCMSCACAKGESRESAKEVKDPNDLKEPGAMNSLESERVEVVSLGAWKAEILCC